MNTQQKNAEDFMKDSTHQDHAEVLVKRDVGELKDMGYSKEQIVERMARKGHLKTDVDRKILESELGKQKVKENPEKYRTEKEKAIKHQTMVNDIIRQSEETVARERAMHRKPKKYY